MANQKRGIYIAGNWKMNQGQRETEKFFDDLKLNERQSRAIESKRLRACIIPPALSLHKAIDCVGRNGAEALPISIGAQNAHWELKGAFTGEISGAMLQEIGVDTVLVGHSERRQYFGETDATVQKRTESLIGQGLQVILCIGETLAEREAGRTADVLTRQLSAVFQNPNSVSILKALNPDSSSESGTSELLIAYEPVWAIGTGNSATPAQAEEAHCLIRTWMAESVTPRAAARLQILYGGSVSPENVTQLLSQCEVDGALVGGASLKPESFLALLAAGEKLLSE